MKCDFCGFEFDGSKGGSGCKGCPMSGSCRKIRCPNCNYEMYPEPEFALIKRIMKLGRKLWTR